MSLFSIVWLESHLDLYFHGPIPVSHNDQPKVVKSNRQKIMIVLHPDEMSLQKQTERVPNTKRDFYSDVYTILNRIELTIWTICAHRVPNPRQ